MAKVSQKSQAARMNPRSRAAKRATSPSIDVDKSIKNMPRALGTSPLLGVGRNSGISKKRKMKQMTKGQRARQEKGLARAEAVMDQMEKKVDDARSKLKKRHLRKALWDDVNSATIDEQRKAIKGSGRGVTLENDEDQENTREPGDIDMSITTELLQDPQQQKLAATVEEQQAVLMPRHDESHLIS